MLSEKIFSGKDKWKTTGRFCYFIDILTDHSLINESSNEINVLLEQSMKIVL